MTSRDLRNCPGCKNSEPRRDLKFRIRSDGPACLLWSSRLNSAECPGYENLLLRYDATRLSLRSRRSPNSCTKAKVQSTMITSCQVDNQSTRSVLSTWMYPRFESVSQASSWILRYTRFLRFLRFTAWNLHHGDLPFTFTSTSTSTSTSKSVPHRRN